MAFDLDQSKSPYGVNTPKIKFLKFQAEVLLISEVSVFIYGSMSRQKQCLLTLLALLFYLRSETTCTVFYIVWADKSIRGISRGGKNILLSGTAREHTNIFCE